MADEEFVIVRNSQLGLLRQHCENCPEFSGQWEALRERMVTIPYTPPSNEPARKKRKELPAAEPHQGPHSPRSSRRQRPSLPSPSPLLPSSSLSLPSRSSSPPSQPQETRRQATGRLRWKEAKDSFLRNVPKTSKWRERQVRVRLVNVEAYEKIIQAFTSHSSVNIEKYASQEDVHSVDELVYITVRFALLTKSSLANAHLQTSFSNFQALLLLSLCAVLEKIGIPYETVDRITQYITDSEEYQRTRLRKSAIWINRLIAKLGTHGWKIHRATELFFIKLRFIRHKENLQCILGHLTTEEFMKCEFSDCLEPEYSIPGLIAYLFNTSNLANGAEKISIDKICDALGYDPTTIPNQVERIYRVHPATKSSSVTSTPFNFHVVVPESFRSENTPLVLASTQTSTANSKGHAYASSLESSPLGAASHISLDAPIIPLFYAMGGHVPKVLLDRATSPQQRLDKHGIAHEVTLHNTSLHRDLIDLLLDDTRLKLAIEHLISLSLISVHELDKGLYVCLCESARISYDQSREHWMHQAFTLCCYAFPRRSDIDPLFESVGRKLLGVLQHLLLVYTEIGLQPPPCIDTVETLLSASKFGPLSDRIELLTMAAKLQKDIAQTYLHAEIVYRQSVLLRFKGRISDSEHAIQEFLNYPSVDLNQISDRFLGLLHLSQANNRAYYFDFCGARVETLKWQPLGDTLSNCQLNALWDQVCCTGRILRGEGRFYESKRCFESCLATTGLRVSKRLLIKSHLADLYCELDYAQCKRDNPCQLGEILSSHTSFLEQARQIIQPEIEYIRACGQQSKGLRRLLLSLAEIQIRQNQHDKAECIIKELLDVYNTLIEPDICDRLGHVRALIAWARISVLPEAEERWQAALLQNRVYNPLEEEVFTCGVIYLSIAAVQFQLGDIDKSRESANHAVDVINRKRPQFLIPGIGTYLFDSAMLELHTMAR